MTQTGHTKTVQATPRFRKFELLKFECVLAALARRRSGSDFGFRISDFPFTEPTSLALGKKRPCAARAFTLLELMVVILLIGILTAVMVPEMRGTYEEALLCSTGRELLNVFSVAYSRAVSLNQLHRVRIDERTGRYFIECRVREDRRGGEFVPVRDVPGCEGELDTRISFTFRARGEGSTGTAGETAFSMNEGESDERPAGTISFYPDGTADGVEVLLRDRDGFRLALQINPVTARVHIIDVGRE